MTPGQTTPESGGDEKTAAVLFAGFMALALGGAGFLVAALAVGIERAWSGSSGARSEARARGGSWRANQQSWLDMDHQRRLDHDQRMRDWWGSGADPASRPQGPSRRAVAGRSLRRLLAGLALSAWHFAGGFREGWANARETRRSGGGWADMWRNRHGGTKPDPEHVEQLTKGPREGEPVPEHQAPEPLPARDDDQPAEPVEEAVEPKPAADRRTAEIPPEQQPAPTEGEPMAGTTHASSAASTNAQAGASNATVLAGKLDTINTTVTAMTGDVDTLAAITQELRVKVTRAADLAHSAGMPTAAVVAVDAIQHAAGVVDARLDDFSTAAASAADQLTAAVDGLTPVTQAEDTLHAAGADGRALDTTAA
jgi:hypothetical protein